MSFIISFIDEASIDLYHLIKSVKYSRNLSRHSNHFIYISYRGVKVIFSLTKIS